MDCEQARDLIVELVYDELPSEFTSELQEHLAECEDCSRYKEEIRETLGRLDQMEELRMPVDLAALHHVIDRKRHRVRHFLRHRWPVWATVGMCSIVLSIFALFVSEIRYEDNALTITFNGHKGDSLAERTTRALAAYQDDQLRFQTQLSGELHASMDTLSQMVEEYESLRDKRIAGAFQQMETQQYQMLAAIQRELETLALQTEDEFKRSYLTMAALVELQ